MSMGQPFNPHCRYRSGTLVTPIWLQPSLLALIRFEAFVFALLGVTYPFSQLWTTFFFKKQCQLVSTTSRNRKSLVTFTISLAHQMLRLWLLIMPRQTPRAFLSKTCLWTSWKASLLRIWWGMRTMLFPRIRSLSKGCFCIFRGEKGI